MTQAKFAGEVRFRMIAVNVRIGEKELGDAKACFRGSGDGLLGTISRGAGKAWKGIRGEQLRSR